MLLDINNCAAFLRKSSCRRERSKLEHPAGAPLTLLPQKGILSKGERALLGSSASVR
jgi:hypothetical protein